MHLFRSSVIALACCTGFLLGACGDGSSEDDPSQSSDAKVDTSAPTDTGERDTNAYLCEDFCAQARDCELSIPGCDHRCGGYESEIKRCVVDRSKCDAVRDCFGTPPPRDAAGGDASNDSDTAPPIDAGDTG